MNAWEYELVKVPCERPLILQALNSRGEDGWELTAVTQDPGFVPPKPGSGLPGEPGFQAPEAHRSEPTVTLWLKRPIDQ